MQRRRFTNLPGLASWLLILLPAALLSGCAAAGALPWWYGWIWLAATALLSGCIPDVQSESVKGFTVQYRSEFNISSLIDGDGSKGYIVLEGSAQSCSTGLSVAVGDLNGDGFAEVIVGSPRLSFGGNTSVGQLSIIYGGAASPGPTRDINGIGPSTGRFFLGNLAYDRLGYSVAVVGSVDGDSRPDLLAGMPSAVDYGLVAVLFGADTLPTSLNMTPGAGRTLLGSASPNTEIGWSVAGGDISGDGIGDIATGAPSLDYYGADSGRVYELQGYAGTWGTTYALDGGARINRWQGTSASGRMGRQVAGGASISGDNYDSLLIAGDMGTGNGKVWARFGDAPFSQYDYLNGQGFTFRLDNDVNGDGLGAAIALADLNGDGFADIVATAPTAHRVIPPGDGDDYYTGRIHVVFGTPALAGTSMPPANLTGTNGFTIVGANANDLVGSGIAVGDINGDGEKDLIVSAYPAGAPAIYVIFGKAGAKPAFCHMSEFSAGDGILLHTFGYSAGEGASPRSIAAGDIDGDGKDDIVVGFADLEGLQGRAFVIYNKALQK